MALPVDLLTLDSDDGGMPGGNTAPNLLDADSLDYDDGGMPFWSQPTEFSTAIMRATQVVVETLRDGDEAGGGNLRATQVVAEMLWGDNQIIYVTALALERMISSAALANKGMSWMVFDEINSLEVDILYGLVPTSAADDVTVLNGANMALWGNELLQFKNVTSLGGTRYRLSYLLRGRFGTEWAMRSHLTGDHFILLTTATIKRIIMPRADLGLMKLYRAVTRGALLDQSVTRSFTNYGVGLKPYAPCFVTGSRDGGNNLTITWVRRDRYGAEWRDAIDVPMNEEFELYEADVIGATGTVARTLKSSTPTVVYSAANQTTDFGAPKALITVVVYQMSETVGRGYGTTISI